MMCVLTEFSAGMSQHWDRFLVRAAEEFSMEEGKIQFVCGSSRKSRNW